MNAQGEDVVAGIRTPVPILELQQVMPSVYDQLREITTRLEKHYKDMQDFEFTIQEGKLYMLQTRNGKRTGSAAVRVAIRWWRELITKEEAIFCGSESLSQLLPRTRSEGVEARRGGDARIARVAGRRLRQGGILIRDGGGVVESRRSGDSRARAKQCRTIFTAWGCRGVLTATAA